jgi:hypothetical protein
MHPRTRIGSSFLQFRPGEPISYFSKLSDVISVMEAPTASLASPEGFSTSATANSCSLLETPPNASTSSYAIAVEQYKKDFHTHYEEYLKSGK